MFCSTNSQHAIVPATTTTKYMQVLGNCSDEDELREAEMVGDPLPAFPNWLCATWNIKGIKSISCLADVRKRPALILRVQHAEAKLHLHACQLVWIPSAWHCVLYFAFFWLPVPVNDIKVNAEGRCPALSVITGWLDLFEVIKCCHVYSPRVDFLSFKCWFSPQKSTVCDLWRDGPISVMCNW